MSYAVWVCVPPLQRNFSKLQNCIWQVGSSLKWLLPLIFEQMAFSVCYQSVEARYYGYYSPERKKKCFWANHCGSWLFFPSLNQWDDSIAGLMPLKTQDAGSPWGQGPCPWSGPGQSQYNAACTGTLKSLVREGGNSSPYIRWARRGVTQLLRFACRFSRTKLPSTRVFGLREQSPWSSK